MRCLVGFLLFVVLYFGSCNVVQQAVTVRSGKAAAARMLKTWHAPIAVVTGLVVLAGCALPTLLVRMSERNAWRECDDYQRR